MYWDHQLHNQHDGSSDIAANEFRNALKRAIVSRDSNLLQIYDDLAKIYEITNIPEIWILVPFYCWIPPTLHISAQAKSPFFLNTKNLSDECWLNCEPTKEDFTGIQQRIYKVQKQGITYKYACIFSHFL